MDFKKKNLILILFSVLLTLFVWSCGHYFNSNGSSSNTLVINLSSTVSSGACTAAIISATDAYGNVIAVTANTNITLSSTGSGLFFSNSTCTSQITSTVVLAAGSSQITVYFKDTVSETVIVTPSAPGFGSRSSTTSVGGGGVHSIGVLLGQMYNTTSPYDPFVINSDGSLTDLPNGTVPVSPTPISPGTGGVVLSYPSIETSCWYMGSTAGIIALSFNPNTQIFSNVTGSPYTDEIGSNHISSDPSGKYLYAANGTTGVGAGTAQVFTYSINSATCALTRIDAATFNDAGAVGVSYSHTEGGNDYLYILEKATNVNLATAGTYRLSSYLVNTATGIPSSTSTSSATTAVASQPSSYSMLQAKNNFIYFIAPLGANNGVYGFSYTSSGVVSTINSGNRYSASVPNDLFTDPNETWLYVVDQTAGVTGGLRQFTINPNGTLTLVTVYNVSNSSTLISARWFTTGSASWIYGIYQTPTNAMRQFQVTNPVTGAVATTQTNSYPLSPGGVSGNGFLTGIVNF